jgi:hypothetical protein
LPKAESVNCEWQKACAAGNVRRIYRKAVNNQQRSKELPSALLAEKRHIWQIVLRY